MTSHNSCVILHLNLNHLDIQSQLFAVEGCRGGRQHGPRKFVGEAKSVMSLYNFFDTLHHISFRADKLPKGMNHLSFVMSIIVCQVHHCVIMLRTFASKINGIKPCNVSCSYLSCCIASMSFAVPSKIFNRVARMSFLTLPNLLAVLSSMT